MMQTKNFFESEMSCRANLIEWGELNDINNNAPEFLLFFGVFLDDEKKEEYAMFGVSGGARYCLKTNNQ